MMESKRCIHPRFILTCEMLRLKIKAGACLKFCNTASVSTCTFCGRHRWLEGQHKHRLRQSSSQHQLARKGRKRELSNMCCVLLCNIQLDWFLVDDSEWSTNQNEVIILHQRGTPLVSKRKQSMAEDAKTEKVCTFTFKKSNRKFNSRKRKTSDDEGKCFQAKTLPVILMDTTDTSLGIDL